MSEIKQVSITQEEIIKKDIELRKVNDILMSFIDRMYETCGTDILNIHNDFIEYVKLNNDICDDLCLIVQNNTEKKPDVCIFQDEFGYKWVNCDEVYKKLFMLLKNLKFI